MRDANTQHLNEYFTRIEEYEKQEAEQQIIQDSFVNEQVVKVLTTIDAMSMLNLFNEVSTNYIPHENEKLLIALTDSLKLFFTEQNDEHIAQLGTAFADYLKCNARNEID